MDGWMDGWMEVLRLFQCAKPSDQGPLILLCLSGIPQCSLLFPNL